MKTTITLYISNDGWRWRMTDARNGRIIGASTEAYARRSACLANLARVTGCQFVIGTRERKDSYTRTATFGPRPWSYATEFRR